MGLDMYFYACEHPQPTQDDNVTIIWEETNGAEFIGQMRKEWYIHGFIADDYFYYDGKVSDFNGVYYDITHLVTELIETFHDPEVYEHLFDLFKELLWAKACGKRIIYSGDY